MTDAIKFTLGGREVEARPGETIWQEGSLHKTIIPHLYRLLKLIHPQAA